MAKFGRRGRRSRRVRFKRKRTMRRRKMFKRKVGRALTQLADTKYIDSSTISGTISNTSGPTLIWNQIPVGTGQGQRIGSKVFLRGMKMRFEIFGNIASLSNTACRLMVFLWNHPNPPVVGNLVTNTTQYTISPYNYDFIKSHDLKILYDKSFVMLNNSETQTAVRYITVKLRGRRLPNKLKFFDSVAQITNWQPYFILRSEQGATVPGFHVITRTWYVDY